MMAPADLHKAVETGDHKTVASILASADDKGVVNTYRNGQTLLTLAISSKDLVMINMLLKQEALEINKPNRYGRTPLHLVSIEGNSQLFDDIVSRGASTDLSDLKGDTALHLASFYDHQNIILKLCEAGSDVNYRNKKGHTPLYTGADNCAFLAVDVLSDRQCDVNLPSVNGDTPLMALVNHILNSKLSADVRRSRLMNTIDKLVNNGANVNESNEHGNTALHLAVRSKNIYSVISLLHNGCRVNIINNEGHTAFTLAVKMKLTEIAHLMTYYISMTSLLDNASIYLNQNRDRDDIAVKVFKTIFENSPSVLTNDEKCLCLKVFDVSHNSDKSTLKSFIRTAEFRDGVSDLLAIQSLQNLCRGIILKNLKDRPIASIKALPIAYAIQQCLVYDHLCISFDPMDVAKFHAACIEGNCDILRKSIDPNILYTTFEGSSPLQKTIMYSNPIFLQMILSRCPSLQLNHTLLHLAAKHGNLSIIQILLNNDCNPYVTNEKHELPVHIAARRGNLEILHNLIKVTKRPHHCDKFGNHVIHYAAASGDAIAVSLLLEEEPELANLNDSYGYSPLHLAISRGNVYLEKNISLYSMFTHELLLNSFMMKLTYSTDKKHVGVPKYSEGVCHVKVIRLLLHHGADSNARSPQGTPQTIALEYGNHEGMIELDKYLDEH